MLERRRRRAIDCCLSTPTSCLANGGLRIHAAMIESLPATQTALFGVPLYYGDGSLMHGGMYLEIQGGCSIQNERVIRREVLRVQHYGKGASPGDHNMWPPGRFPR